MVVEVMVRYDSTGRGETIEDERAGGRTVGTA
jgi:hypothetical protein